MLTIYRRHKKACGHRDKGRRYRGCQCPIWVDGFLAGKEIRESLTKLFELRDWQKAQEKVREWEASGSMESEHEAEAVTVEQSTKEFLQDAEARNLRASTVYKYRLLFAQIKAFALDAGFRFLNEFDLSNLRRFRATCVGGGEKGVHYGG